MTTRFQIPKENIGAYDIEWCYDCERPREDCVCEELCDHFRESVGSTGDGDVCFPAPSPVPLKTFNAGESVVGTDSDTLVRGERQPASATVGSNPTALRPLQLDWPAWRMSFSAYGEHMGWEVPQ